MSRPDPDKLIAGLRQRAGEGRFTLDRRELEAIAAALERLQARCGEAYQVVGSLATDAGLFHDPAVKRALDLLSQPMRKGDILPFRTVKDLKPASRPKRSGK